MNFTYQDQQYNENQVANYHSLTFYPTFIISEDRENIIKRITSVAAGE